MIKLFCYGSEVCDKPCDESDMKKSGIQCGCRVDGKFVKPIKKSKYNDLASFVITFLFFIVCVIMSVFIDRWLNLRTYTAYVVISTNVGFVLLYEWLKKK